MKVFRDRVAVVTGAGSGIGREVALELARRGARVALVDWNSTRLNETVSLVTEIGGTCSAHVADLGVRDDVYALADAVSSALGNTSILVNNAAVMIKSARFDDVPEADLDKSLAVNLLGAVRCTKAFLPQLLAADGAAVVNVSSLGGLVGFMYAVPYATAKFGLRGFSEALRMDLMDTKVHVMPVFPGPTRTNIVANSIFYSDAEKQAAQRQIESVHMVPASLAAKKIVQGIARGKNRVLIGRETLAMDLIARLLPGAYSRLLFRPVKKMLEKSLTDG